MTSERVYTLKTTLRSSLMVELKTYLNSVKLIIPFSIACLIYWGALLFRPNPNWLVVVSFFVSWLPYLYLLAVGTKNGYLRTITSKRKTSLINRLMFRISNLTIVAFYFGFFGMPSFTALFPVDITSSVTVKSLIDFLGYPGFAIIITAAAIYALAFIKVAKTEYRQLIKQVI